MARTRQIKIFYSATKNGIAPPAETAIARKDVWLKEITQMVRANGVPMLIEVAYRLVNPEVERQRKFFNGPVVEYWLIQNKEMLQGRPDNGALRRARETLLSDALGFDMELIGRTERRRKSTADFTNTQQWHDFLETLRETEFDPNGYEFPDSEHFWAISKQYGYEQARDVVVKQLQEHMAKKLATKEG